MFSKLTLTSNKLVQQSNFKLSGFMPQKRTALDLKINGYKDYPKDTTMWKSQPKIPRLPIPTLQETAERYIEFLDPLVTAEQLETTKKIVQDFIKPGGEGEKLQEELKRLDAESPTSWLEGWWDSMYLEIRDPLIFNVNPFLEIIPDPRRTTQTVRAAAVIHSCLEFLKRIENNSLTPDFERDTPLDMSQYLRLFRTARLPRPSRDECVTFSDSKHIVVICNHHYYTLSVLDDAGNPRSEGEILTALNSIVEEANRNAPTHLDVGVLTTESRQRWYELRTELERDPLNKASLEKIDSAIMVYSLDPIKPSNDLEISKALLHRDGSHRWYDKFQIVTLGNGITATILEHTPIDGHTALRLFMETTEILNKRELATAASVPAPFSQLEWNLENDKLVNGFKQATNNVKALIDSTQSYVLSFSTYGKNWITSRKLSPDSLVQMAFQIAYYRLNNRFDGTYESANTKRFLAGRTECLRTASTESADLCRIWVNPQSSIDQKVSALRKACEKHTQRMNLCKNGKGVDRHWYGLHNLAKHKQQRLPKYNIPLIFLDNSYSRLSTSVLSTSNVTASCFHLFGFGAVVSNGLGLAYNIFDSNIYINVTSFLNSYSLEAERFGQTLEEVFLEIKKVVGDK